MKNQRLIGQNYHAEKGTVHPGGFTLIEMLIVIAIIGILATATTAGFGTAGKSSRDNERITEITQIALALEMYFNACKQYPAPAGAWLAAGANNGNGAGGNCPNGVTLGRFLNSIPTDPLNSGSNVYVYATNGAGFNHSTYVLRAVLETDNRALNDDIDGTVNLVDCADITLHFCKGS